MQNETEKCEFCGKLCSQAVNLNKHIYTVHGNTSFWEHKDLRKRKSIDSTIDSNLEKDKEAEDDSEFKID